MTEEAVGYRYTPSTAKLYFSGRLRHYRNLLVRKWWVLAAGAALTLLLETGVARFQPPSYLSTGEMIVNVKLSIPQGSVFTEELSNFLGTQAALMQSEVVLNRALARVSSQRGIELNQIAELPALRVTVSPRTTIFHLAASGPDPKFIREFLQAVMQEYIGLKREMRRQTSDSTVADLSGEVTALESEWRGAERAMAEFQGTNSLVWLEEQGHSLGNYLADLNQRLAAMKSEYDLLQTLTVEQNLQRAEIAVSGLPPSPGNPAGSTNGVVNNTALALDYLKAKQQLLLLKADQEDLGRYLRPKHPKMVALSEEVARRERLLEIYRQQNAEQLEARKATVALQLQNLQKEVTDWNAKLVEVSRKSAEYQRLKSNAQRLQVLYQQLVGTVHTVDANKEIGAESVSILEPASAPVLDVRKARNNLIFVGIGCILATVAALLFLDRMDDRVNSFAELQELFEENVLVQIPRQKTRDKKGLNLIQPNDERHPFIEAYRNLRSSLLYMTQTGKRPRILLLTSSIPNEGKSLTAANLAIIMASAGSRVLLIDADLRKGVLHHRFGLDAGAGLCEALEEGIPWQELVQPTTHKSLSLLPRGRVSNSSGELFLKPATDGLLRQMAERFDLVILDTAPVMAADDVTTLAPLVDGVLFVLRAEHTSAQVAHAALDLLYQRNVRVLGLIFNAVRSGAGDYYYYYGYKDYYADHRRRSDFDRERTAPAGEVSSSA